MWPLMKDSITLVDKLRLCYFLLKNSKLTQGKTVEEFEKAWSEWLNCNYSVFVNSGSSANLLLFDALATFYNIRKGSKVLVPATTWTTTVSPIVQLGYTPIFCDVNKRNFGMDVDAMKEIAKQHPDISVVFVAHLLGLASPVEEYKKIFPTAIFIQDICESHGVLNPKGQKYGSEVSTEGATFSFYFGHHMTSIEGGMISVNSKGLYNVLKMKRSHGLSRESIDPSKYTEENPHIDPHFLFMYPGYNLRNTELYAKLGLIQLKRLDKFIARRKSNFRKFYLLLEQYPDKFILPEYQEGNSSFCLPFICRQEGLVDILKAKFKAAGIEYRPVIAGNLLQHPAYKKYATPVPNADYIHKNGVYVGNNQFVGSKELKILEKLLKEL